MIILANRLAQIMEIFHKRAAAFLWDFALVFMAFLVAMSYELLREGPPPDYSPILTMAIVGGFWMAGMGLSGYVATKPCVYVSIQCGIKVSIRWRYPFKTAIREVSCSDFNPAVVAESVDDESNPYFFARLTLPDGTHVDFAEGHDKERCEIICIRFNDALSPLSSSYTQAY